LLDETGGSVLKIKNYDIVVIGASLGGVMAAYSAAKQGKKVVLTEETDWIGGRHLR
jgi:NADPH-dependent 2,4-dienoyl-CoA reductase/sulfur reductase-like enzyme